MTLEYASLDELLPNPSLSTQKQLGGERERQKIMKNKVKKGSKKKNQNQQRKEDVTCELLNMKHSDRYACSVVDTYLEEKEREGENGSKNFPQYLDTYDVEEFPGIMPNIPFDRNLPVQGLIDGEFASAYPVEKETGIPRERSTCNTYQSYPQAYKQMQSREPSIFHNDSNHIAGNRMSCSKSKNVEMSKKRAKQMPPPILEDIFEETEGEEEDEEEEEEYAEDAEGAEDEEGIYDEAIEDKDEEGMSYEEEIEMENENENENENDINSRFYGEEDDENSVFGEQRKSRKSKKSRKSEKPTKNRNDFQESLFDAFLYLLSGIILIFGLEQILYIGSLFIKQI